MDNNAHSVFLLHYHLIMVVKYRRKVIDDKISNRARDIFSYIAPKYGIALGELSKFINTYKSASSRLIKKEHPDIREKLWKEAFWSQSFCLLTTGGASVDTIRAYIESQGNKHE